MPASFAAAISAARTAGRGSGRTVDERREIGVAVLPGAVHGGAAAVVLDRAVGAVLDQDARKLAAVELAGLVQRREPIIVLRIHVAPALDEGHGCLGPVVVEAHPVQYRAPVPVAEINLHVGGPLELRLECLRGLAVEGRFEQVLWVVGHCESGVPSKNLGCE